MRRTLRGQHGIGVDACRSARSCLANSGVATLTKLVAGIAIATGAAHAQQQPDAVALPTRLQTVDVNARAGGSTSPLPATDTPLDGADVERLHVDALDDLPDRVPNLRLGSLGGRAGQHFIALRGFINAWSAAESAVALRIDGVNISDPVSFDQRLFDVQRIDVLAGPQGSRSGANAEAGVIDIVTRRPNETAHAWADVGAASRGGFETGAGVSGALASGLCGSLAVLRDGSDGEIDNLAGNRPYDTRRDRNLRGRLIWQPDARSEVEFMLLDRHSNDRGGETYLPLDRAAFNALPTLGSLRLGKFDQAIDHEGSNGIDATIAALSAHWSGDAVKLGAQVSTRHSSQASSTDYDLSPQPWFVMDSRWTVHEQQAELRAESAVDDAALLWLAGVAADQRNFDTLRLFKAGPGNPWQLPVGAYVRTDARLPDHSQALFGEASLALDDAQRWRVGAGARLQWSQRELDFGPNALGAPAAAPRSNGRQLLPKLTLDYRATATTRLYASLADGGKAGGFNPGTFSAGQAAYRAERLRAAEIGAIGSSGDGAFDWRLAAFRNRVHDYQDLTFAETEFTTYLRNVHRASMQGIEAQADWHVDTHWQIGARLGTVRTRHDDDLLDPASGVRLDGHRLTQVPNYNATLDLQYRAGNWFGRAAWIGAGNYAINAFDAATGTLQQASVAGYRVVDLEAGWSRRHWSLRAYAHNLGDRRYFTSATFGFAAVALYPGGVGSIGTRRTIGAVLRWDY